MIRKIQEKDTEIIYDMMNRFYHSDAVYTNGSEEIYRNNIKNCLGDNPYVEGYVFETDDHVVGYAMIAKSYSTEFGKQCIWIEDLYLEKPYRRKGYGTKFFTYIKEQYPKAIYRLEVEDENINAIQTYKANTFTELPYKEMIRND